MAEKKEGWEYKYKSPKWHYFKNGQSICGKWMYLGDDLEKGNNNSPDNCKSCIKKLKALEGKE